MQHKLLSEIQVLPPELALEYVNRALKEIYREYDWSFLYNRGFIRTPALITVGTVNVTFGSLNVIASAELKAILDAITINDVPLVGRQLRVNGGQSAGRNFTYTITGYDTITGTLTIDEPYQDASNASATFQLFKNLYTAPTIVEKDSNGNIIFNGIDFEFFEYIYAPFAERKVNLDKNRSEIDAWDRSRNTIGDPRYITSFSQDSAGNQLFELYPIPSQERIYQVLYKRAGRDLGSDEELPKILGYSLVLEKAKLKALEWLTINADKVNDKRSPNVFMNLIALKSNPNMDNSYQNLLNKAKMQDEALYPQSLIDMGGMYPYYEDVIVETVLMDF